GGRPPVAVTRQLRRLRGHGLLHKVAKTHRYVVSEVGRRTITALLAARNATVEHRTGFAAREAAQAARNLGYGNKLSACLCQLMSYDKTDSARRRQPRPAQIGSKHCEAQWAASINNLAQRILHNPPRARLLELRHDVADGILVDDGIHRHPF